MEVFEPPTGEPALQSGKFYHVFLSFRGPDVRKTLVDHLYEALSAAGLNVFKDDEKLEKGEKISPSLEKAIKSSAVLIPIFSKGYADSEWCLREAAEMLSATGLIIPLFYHVNPTHVRFPLNHHSPYKPSFLKHYGHADQHPREETEWWKRAIQRIRQLIFGHSTRYTTEEIDGWKIALREICERSGWSMDITKGFEAQLVKRVVKDLIKTLDKMSLEVAKHPVGMDGLKKSLIQILNLESREEVVKVGIWGIGGIGKTAIATALYNQLYAEFEAVSYVIDVRAKAAEPRGLITLQKQILKELIKYDEEVPHVSHGKQLFENRLRGRRVLLILDNVDAFDQLDALVGDWLGPGSRVIITSRDKGILHVAGISSGCIHEMSGLEMNEAFELFNWHAFHRTSPSPGYEDLSEGIVKACKGHPLSLVVTGSSLFGKDHNKDFWTEALANVTLNQDVHKILKISYDPLNEVEKEIFVDIACFFSGEHRILPILFWKSLHIPVENAVDSLSMKSLIKINDDGLFHMHELLQDMGRAIAENDKKGTRLWKVARSGTSSDNINLSRFRLNGGRQQRLDLLFKSRGLLYLDLQNLSIEDMREDYLARLPRSLIWLRLEHCHFATEMNRAESRGSHCSFEDTCQLKIVQLKGCSYVNTLFLSSLFSLPSIQLEYLDLGGCKSLNKIPHTIGNLSQLQELELRCCEILISLPDTIGDLSKLRHLNLEGCSNLNNLPNSIGNLSELRYLNLKECFCLCNLPDTVGNLLQLHDLDLEGCINLVNLPDTISGLSKLQRLNLGSCKRLPNLPNITENDLPQLRYLTLRDCKISRLPCTLLNRPQLEYSF